MYNIRFSLTEVKYEKHIIISIEAEKKSKSILYHAVNAW